MSPSWARILSDSNSSPIKHPQCSQSKFSKIFERDAISSSKINHLPVKNTSLLKTVNAIHANEINKASLHFSKWKTDVDILYDTLQRDQFETPPESELVEPLFSSPKDCIHFSQWLSVLEVLSSTSGFSFVQSALFFTLSPSCEGSSSILYLSRLILQIVSKLELRLDFFFFNSSPQISFNDLVAFSYSKLIQEPFTNLYPEEILHKSDAEFQQFVSICSHSFAKTIFFLSPVQKKTRLRINSFLLSFVSNLFLTTSLFNVIPSLYQSSSIARFQNIFFNDILCDINSPLIQDQHVLYLEIPFHPQYLYQTLTSFLELGCSPNLLSIQPLSKSQLLKFDPDLIPLFIESVFHWHVSGSKMTFLEFQVLNLVLHFLSYRPCLRYLFSCLGPDPHRDSNLFSFIRNLIAEIDFKFSEELEEDIFPTDVFQESKDMLDVLPSGTFSFKKCVSSGNLDIFFEILFNSRSFWEYENR